MPPTKRIAKRVASPATPTKRVARPLAAVPEPDPDDEAPAPDIEDDDDEPTPPKALKSANGAAKRRLPKGWSGGQKTMESTSDYAQAFRPDETSQIIKFLEDSPYVAFRRHWIEGTNESGQRNVRAYTCPLSFDDPCPLCEAGDKPQAVSAFNVVLCGDDGQLTLKSWEVGSRLFGVLKGYANDPKIAPLTKGFFLVNKTGKKQNVQYNVSPVRATSLREDYDIEPPSDDDIARITPYTDEIVRVETPKKLRELAQELTADYDD